MGQRDHPAVYPRRHGECRSSASAPPRLDEILAGAAQSRGNVLTLAASEVSRGLAGFSATFGAELRAQWRSDLAAEISRVQSARASSSSSSSSSAAAAQDPQPPEVSSVHSKIKHRIVIGPADSLDPGCWVSVCHWRFGRAGCWREPTSYDARCGKCWPAGP